MTANSRAQTGNTTDLKMDDFFPQHSLNFEPLRAPPAHPSHHHTTTASFTWMTRMLSPVSCASCSRMCRVGFGVATNAAFNVSSCLALMVVRGPRRLVPEFCSSFSILFVSLSDDVELSVSLMSSCIGSCRSGDKLLSVHDDTACVWVCVWGGGWVCEGGYCTKTKQNSG